MAKQRTYRVGRRFEIWVEKSVKAFSMAQAVEHAEQMQLQDFAEFDDDSEIIVEVTLPGTSAIEDF